MIKTVIFDIDGTMYSYETANKIARDALKQYCFAQLGWDAQKFDRLFQQAQAVVKRRINQDCCVNHNRLIRFQCMLELDQKPIFPYALQMYHCYWDTLLEVMRPEPGLLEFIKALSVKGIRIGIGTDLTAYIQFRKLNRLGVSDYISWMVSSEEAGVEKPDPRFYQLCLEKAGAVPSECMFIGEHFEKDVIGSAKSGMKAVWYHPEALMEDTDSGGYDLLACYQDGIKLLGI